MSAGSNFIKAFRTVLIFCLSALLTSCIYSEPVSTIIRLRNIDNIKIISLTGDERIVKANITDEDEINRFISLFRVPKRKSRQVPKPQKEYFSKNAEIVISFTNSTPPLVIDVDTNRGYSVVINNKRHFEPFDYGLSRFIVGALFY